MIICCEEGERQHPWDAEQPERIPEADPEWVLWHMGPLRTADRFRVEAVESGQREFEPSEDGGNHTGPRRRDYQEDEFETPQAALASLPAFSIASSMLPTM